MTTYTHLPFLGLTNYAILLEVQHALNKATSLNQSMPWSGSSSKKPSISDETNKLDEMAPFPRGTVVTQSQNLTHSI